MRFNLLPEEERGRSRMRPGALRFAAIGAWVLTALVVMATVFHVALARQAQEQAQLLRPRAEAVRLEQARLSAVRRDNAELSREVAELEQAIHTASNEALLALLEAAAAAVPEGAWLEWLLIEPGDSLWADGYAADAAQLAALLSALRRVPGAAALELTSIERAAELDGSWRKFSVWLTVVSE